MPSRSPLHPLRALATLSLVCACFLTLGATSADASPTRASAMPATAEPTFGQYLGACKATSDCTSGDICYPFKKRGPHCTHTCEEANDCAAPSHGCTKISVCGLGDPQKTES